MITIGKDWLQRSGAIQLEDSKLIVDFDVFDAMDKYVDASEFSMCLDEYRVGGKNGSLPSIEIRSSSPVYLSGSAYSLFENCKGNIVGCENLDVSDVTDMSYMFYNCSSNDFNPDVSQWNTSNVTSMDYMFFNCRGSNFNPDVSKWDVSNVRNMESMFCHCGGSKFNPYIGSWCTRNVENMNYMFGGCFGKAFEVPFFKELDLSNTGRLFGVLTDANIDENDVIEKLLSYTPTSQRDKIPIMINGEETKVYPKYIEHGMVYGDFDDKRIGDSVDSKLTLSEVSVLHDDYIRAHSKSRNLNPVGSNVLDDFSKVCAVNPLVLTMGI